MDLNEKALEAAADGIRRAQWQWATEPRPWECLHPEVKEIFLRDARAAISAYLKADGEVHRIGKYIVDYGPIPDLSEEVPMPEGKVISSQSDGLTEAIEGDVGELVKAAEDHCKNGPTLYSTPMLMEMLCDTLLSLSQDREGLSVALQVAHENLEAQQREIERMKIILSRYDKGLRPPDLILEQQREIGRLQKGLTEWLNIANMRADECDALEGKSEDQQQEIERLREALREIADGGWIAKKCWSIARTALASGAAQESGEGR